MLKLRSDGHSIRVGRNLSVSFQRTLRVPDDERTYRIPPGFGDFPICRVEDYLGSVPESWKEPGAMFLPVYQREAVWLNFDGAYWRPNAVKVAVGDSSAITGRSLRHGLDSEAQDYIVCPDQGWLDGTSGSDGFTRQIVCGPPGEGPEDACCIRLIVHEPKPGRFPEREPREKFGAIMACCLAASEETGSPAVGRMRQMIRADEHGADSWDEDNYGEVTVRLVTSAAYGEITGSALPPTPVSARIYEEYGLPWLAVYEEECDAPEGGGGGSSPGSPTGKGKAGRKNTSRISFKDGRPASQERFAL